jgi:hypothetical protein
LEGVNREWKRRGMRIHVVVFSSCQTRTTSSVDDSHRLDSATTGVTKIAVQLVVIIPGVKINAQDKYVLGCYAWFQD